MYAMSVYADVIVIISMGVDPIDIIFNILSIYDKIIYKMLLIVHITNADVAYTKSALI